MISPEVFKECWEMLERRWGEQPRQRMDDIYDWISRTLSDEQLRVATQVIVARWQFFPKAQDFIDVAPRPQPPRQIEPPRVEEHTCSCGKLIYGTAKTCITCHLEEAGVTL